MSLLRRSLPLLLTILLAACQGSNGHPVPSVSQIGADLKCAQGDHPHEDFQAGWGFCYPGTWHYIEKAQAVASPPGLDLTFDITDIPCTSPAAGSTSSQPVCSPNAGLFAFMIISTYERGDSVSLAGWVQTNLVSPPSTTPSATPSTSPSASPSASPLVLQPISWGDATEAARLPDGRRVALTQHHVVILDLHSSSGHLDLEHEMSSRLDTWKFTY